MEKLPTYLRTYGLVAGSAGILLAAVAVQCAAGLNRTALPVPALPQLLSHGGDGWSAMDLPLAETNAAETEVREVLGFDDYVYRRFRDRANRAFDVYVAYWAAGKMPPSMVAAHTPDVCWVGDGWSIARAHSDEALGDLTLVGTPGEWRRMRAPDGEIREVWFSHIGGRRYFELAESGLTRPSQFGKRLKELWAELWSGSREQWFIRISSEQPLETLARDPFFRDVIVRINQQILTAQDRQSVCAPAARASE